MPGRVVGSSASKLCDEFVRISERFDSIFSKKPVTRSVPPNASVLDRVVPYLDSSRIPASDNNLSASEKDTVQLALSSCRLLGSVVGHRYESRDAFQRASKLWPDFWQWAQYLLRTRVEQNPYEYSSMPESDFKTVMLVFRVIGCCCRDERVRHQMCATPGLLEIITYYWIHEEHCARIENLDMFSSVLGQFLDFDMRPNWAEVHHAANGTTALAKAALRRVRTQLARPWNIRRLSHCLAILQYLINRPESDTQEALVRAGVVPLAIRCLTALHDKPNRDLERRSVHVCHLLLYCGCMNGGARSVIQALECGVLPAMLGSARFVKRAVNDWDAVPLSVFSETFTSYLTYRSVVRVAARQCEACEGIDIESGALKDAWEGFKRIVLERKELMADFDVQQCRSCAYCKAEVANAKILKECASCRGPRYCSAECQKKDWGAHKTRCMLHQKMYVDEDEPAMKISMLERDFLSNIVYKELLLHLRPLNRTLEREFSDCALEELMFKVDFHDRPPTVTIAPLHDPDGDSDYIGPANKIWVNIHTCRGQQCLTVINQIRIPPGLRRPENSTDSADSDEDSRGSRYLMSL